MSNSSPQLEGGQLQPRFKVLVVSATEAELHVPSPVQGNAFWNQFNPRRFAAYRIEETTSGKVVYVATPFRAEANLAILHFRVAYELAHQYLETNAESVVRTENPPLLKIIEDNKEWAAGALWFMEYTKSDLGSQGDSQAGDYAEVAMTFTATEHGRHEVTGKGRYTGATVLATSYFPTITAKLVLNNWAAIVGGRAVGGFDKHAAEVEMTVTERGVRASARLLDGKQLFVIQIPKVGACESLKNQIRLLREKARLFGLWAVLSATAKMALRMIPGLRNLITADRCDGYTTLRPPFPGMPRRLRMDSDMNPWSVKLGEINSEDITDGIDAGDEMFGALLKNAEFETSLNAQFRGAFGLAENGVAWLHDQVGRPTQ